MAQVQDGSVKVTDYDDLEDAIWNLNDELWTMAGLVANQEPLQAKQQFELVKIQFKNIESFINGLYDTEKKEES